MKINAVTSAYYTNLPQKQHKQKNSGYLDNNLNSSLKSPNSSPNFGILIIDDLYNWGVRKSNKKLLEQTAQQIREIRKQNLDDVDLLSKRKGVSKDTIRNYYGEYIDKAGISPKYDGNEIGLNKIVGYSLEKFELLKRFILPIMESAKTQTTKHSVNTAPAGLILHGREGSGKDYLAHSLLEHLNYKAKTENLPIKTMIISGEWWKGGTKENLETLQMGFEQARQNSKNGEHTVILIDNMSELISDRKDSLLKEEFINQTQHPKKDNITWLATVNDTRDLSSSFFKRSRTSMAMEIDKTKSESESAALLNHYIADSGRAADYSEDYILSYIRNSKIPVIPRKIQQIVQFAHDELRMTKDYSTKKKGTFISPVGDMELMMGTDFVSKYNRNKLIINKPEVQIPKRLVIDTLKQFSD